MALHQCQYYCLNLFQTLLNLKLHEKILMKEEYDQGV